MTLTEFNYRFSLLVCGVIVGCYAILYQVVAHTGIIERFMSMNFQWWDFVLIAGFIIARLLTYLLVPSVLVALGVHAVVRRFR